MRVNPKQCPNCRHLCLDTERVCPRCRASLSLGWAAWLPAIVSAIFAVLMGAFLLYAGSKTRGTLSTTTAIATNITNAIFMGAAIAVGAFIGWVLSAFFKAANRR
jgi:hypothetical protein